MSADWFEYLMKDREAELRNMYEAQMQAQLPQQQEQFREQFQQALENTLMVRFPQAPLAVVRDIRRIQQPAALHQLIVAVQQVADLAAAQQLLHETAQRAEMGE